MMNQKKLAFSLLGIIVFVALYYAITGYLQTTKISEQIIKLKQQANVQLTEIQTNGFSLSEREIKKDTEHFVICLDDPDKASAFLTQKGIQLKIEEAKEIKGLKLGVDLAYLSDTIALELYPVALPTNLKTILDNKKDQNLLVQIERIIKEKTFFAHIDIEHSATTFKGYLKDINETVEVGKEVKLSIQGFHFSGNIKDEKIVKLTQIFETMHFYIRDLIDRYISGLQKNYVFTGPTVYDYTTDYSIKKIKINEGPRGELLADNIALISTSSVKNGLAFETLHTEIENSELMFEKEKFDMHNVFLDMNVSNLHVDAFEKLQKMDPNKKEEYDALLEKILSSNIHIEIPTLSVDKVTFKGKNMDGFALHSIMDIDPSLDIYRLEMNPKHVLGKMDGNITLSLSKEILELIKEDPKAMLVYMMYRPKRVLNQRIYDLKFKNGLLNINGKDFKLNGKPVKF